MLFFGAAHFWMNSPPAVRPLPLRQIPLLAAALAFAAGDLLARQWHPTWVLAASTALLALLSLLSLWLAPRAAAVPVLALWCAAGCWCAQVQPRPSTHPELRPYADGLLRTARGHIVRVRELPPAQPDTDAPQPLRPWQLGAAAWEADSAPARQSIDLELDALEYVSPELARLDPVSGGVRVTLLTAPDQPSVALHCGDEIELPLRLHPPDLYLDPGAFSYADELQSQGIQLLASARASRLQTVATSPPTWRCRLYAAQSWASRQMQAFVRSPANLSLPTALRLQPEDALMLDAMLFGDRSGLSHSLRSGFERTGTFHLFVVSGLHVALLAGGVYWLIRKLRAARSLAFGIAMILATGYALLTGFGVPSQRALLMVGFFLLARVLFLPAVAMNVFGLAALVVLVLDPASLFTASFQMTFLVILAVAGIAAPILERSIQPRADALCKLRSIRRDAHLHPRWAQLRTRVRMEGDLLAELLPIFAPRWLMRWVSNLPGQLLRAFWLCLEALVLCLCIELCMSLTMAVYFHRATLFALPLNLVVVPMLAALLTCAVTLFCTQVIASAFAHTTLGGHLAAHLALWLPTLPAIGTSLLLHLMHALVEHVQRRPLADLRMPTPTHTAILSACLAMTAACILLRSSRWSLRLPGYLALALLPLAIFLPPRPALHPGLLEVTALDVGQGDSLLVVSPDGHTMLVDAGGPVGAASAAPAAWDFGEQVVAPYLWSRHIGHLDAVVLTHAHSDHMGGMPAILRDLHPGELLLSLLPSGDGGSLDSPNLRSLLELAAQLHIPVRRLHAGDSFPWHGLQARVLSPAPAYSNSSFPSNDDSLVLRLDDDRASVLLEGDAEASSEDTMLERGFLAPVTLLKVGHHGSKTSTNPEFLAAVQPRMAVISVGRRNTFGHPRAEVLARLEAARVRTFRTDREGAETFLLAPDGTISTTSPARPDRFQW